MGFTKKQRLFIEHYLQCWNAAEAARKAGYSERTARYIGYENLTKPHIKEKIQERIDEIAMSADEVLMNLSEIGRGTVEDFMNVDEDGRLKFDFKRAQEENKLKLINKIVPTREGLKVELHDRMKALQLLGKHHGLFADEDGESEEEAEDRYSYFQLPASAIGPSYFETYRHIKAHDYTKFVEKGGRGALKSSFFSLVLIDQLINNPEEHALVLRQVANTLRDSVYSQIEWAINYLGLEEKFKCTTSPLQIEYLPTGQMIYFRGGDKPLKIKSIKPKFGHIGILWFEELDQFHGENSIRSIYQSAIRGGDNAVVFYSYNPPRSKNNWVYKWLEIPDEDRFVHHSTYLEAPRDWLGEAFIREAEHVKETNPDAYKHEYLGEAVALGGLVFDNVEFLAITDEEIEQFDHILHGLDWGYTIDPTNYTKAHFDAAKRTLYIFSEWRDWKQSNREIYDHILMAGYNPKQLLIPDSAEPKSIADLRSYGAYVKGAEKGADSVRYSMKWLQTIKIVIDPKRCPYHAEEFRNYEYEQNKDGEFISAYPDKDNHAIDSVRYATNLYWRRAGV